MKVTKKQLKQIEKFVRNKIDDLTWFHVQQIRPIAQRLAELEKADREIIDVAVLLHDISKTAGELTHARVGAGVAEEFLTHLGLEGDFIKRVAHCIRTHSSPWAKNAPMPKTLEAKVLFDADMIQQLSPFGIVKHVLKHKEKKYGQMIKAMRNDLNVYGMLLTKSGRKMARTRVKYIKDFFKQFK